MKKGDFYAHGETLHEAHKFVHDKFNKAVSISDRIKAFKDKFQDFNAKVLAKDLFEWHYFLTGSCKLGRLALISERNIDINNDLVSVNEFIEMSRDKFGWEIIKLLKSC